jgi:peptide/nickel transport system permease protein
MLGLLVAISLGYGLLAKMPGVPACPFGEDPKLPFETICGQTFGGLWRSMGLGLFAGGAACAVAVALAFAGRALGGAADVILEKAAEAFFSIPDVLILITIGFVANVVRGGGGVSLGWMAASLVAVGWAAPTRMVQNRLRTLEQQDFVRAAFAIGVPRRRVLLLHLMPYVAEYVLAIFLLRVPAVVLTESTISYLGFGLPLDQPSLGKFIGDHWQLLVGPDWPKVVPAWALLVALVVAFQWVGTGLLAKSGEAKR